MAENDQAILTSLLNRMMLLIYSIELYQFNLVSSSNPAISIFLIMLDLKCYLNNINKKKSKSNYHCTKL